jgi:hypothetical protein
VAARNDRCTALLQPSQRWHCCLDAQVVDDEAVTQGHIEVDSNENALTFDIT